MKVGMVCLECRKTYIDPYGRVDRSKYCSRKCANIASEQRQEIAYIQQTCSICQVEFTTTKRHPRKTCSPECKKLGIARGRQLGRESHAKGKRVEVICTYCNKVFTKYKYRVTERNFCSRQCKNKHLYKPEIHLVLTCQTCGQEYETTEAQVRLRNSKFCSRACHFTDRSHHMKGKKNPNWKGGITCAPYAYARFEASKRRALRRDNHACQSCSAIDGAIIDVHHIIPVWLFAPHYHNAHFLMNLITLCRLCHRRVEKNLIPCPFPPSGMLMAPA